MRTWRWLPLAALLLAGTSWSQNEASQPGEPAEPHLVVEATALLCIRVDSGQIQLNGELLDALVQSESIAGEVERVLVERGAVAPGDLQFGAVEMRPLGRRPRDRADAAPISDSDMVVNLVVNTSGSLTRETLAEALRLAVERLRAALQAHAEQSNARLQQALEQTRAHADSVRAMLAELQQRRSAAIEAAGGLPPDQNHLNRLSQLQSKREALELKRTSLQAREAYLARRISELGSGAEQQLAQDPTLPELKEIVAAYERELAQIREGLKQGIGSDADLAASLERVAAARMQLLDRQRKLVGPLEAELSRLNVDLSQRALERTETEAELGVLVQQAGGDQRQMARLVDEFVHEIEPRLRRLREELQRLSDEILSLDRTLRFSQPPDVQIIGAAPAAGTR